MNHKQSFRSTVWSRFSGAERVRRRRRPAKTTPGWAFRLPVGENLRCTVATASARSVDDRHQAQQYPIPQQRRDV